MTTLNERLTHKRTEALGISSATREGMMMRSGKLRTAGEKKHEAKLLRVRRQNSLGGSWTPLGPKAPYDTEQLRQQSARTKHHALRGSGLPRR